MKQTLQLKEPLNSAVVGKPFPAEVNLTFSRVNGNILVHHPDNALVTKIVKAENVLRIDIQACSIREIIKAHLNPGIQSLSNIAVTSKGSVIAI